MKTKTLKRLVLDIDPADHAGIKALAASAGTSIKSVVMTALRSELTARQRALSRPAPRATQ